MKKNINFRCPCHFKSALVSSGLGLKCSRTNCPHATDDRQFPIRSGVPVLISDIITDTVCDAESIGSYVPRSKLTFLRKVWRKLTESKITKENIDVFIQEIHKSSNTPKVLVIGSGELGSGMYALWNDPSLVIHGFDVYASDSTDFIADAHNIPLEGDSYDGVIIQAVLEHVVDPRAVVKEIYRVLKLNGLVYAEPPFMQQVHEAGYDFTRFTVTGHRYLFKHFSAIKFGGNGNSDVVLSWSIRYFVLSLTRSKLISKISGAACSLLLMPFRRFIDERFLFDGPSGVYFLGRKEDSTYKVSHKTLVGLYRGFERE